MPNHHDWERAELHAEDAARLRHELDELRAELARVRAGDPNVQKYNTLAQAAALQVKQNHELILELNQVRADSALVVHALDRAMQLINGLIMWLPDGQVLPPDLAGLHENFRAACDKVFRREEP